MFETFTRTEQSWGKAAHMKPEDLGKILASGDSLKKLDRGKNAKAYKATMTEKLVIERKSEPQIVYSSSQDRVGDACREVTFDMIPCEVFDEVAAVMKKHGLDVRPSAVYSYHRAT